MSSLPSVRLPAFPRYCLYSLILGLLAAGPGWSGTVGECVELPENLVLDPGRALHLANHAFELAATVRHPRSEGLEPSGAELVLDLFARSLDPQTRLARPGSHVPQLRVDYVLSGPDGTLGSGRLTFRFPSQGPSYGTTIVLDEPVGPEALGLSLVLRDVGGSGGRGDCPRLPLGLRFSLNVAELTEEPVPTAIPTAPADNLRFDLVGTLDPNFGGGNQYSDIWGYSDGATHLAILGGVDGTHFIDVTDAANPVEVAFVSGPNSPWRDMKTYQHYAFIGTEGSGFGQGMQIVDLSNPLSPTLVGTYTQTFVTAHNLFIETDLGQLWAVGTNAGTKVLDLSADPLNPAFVGSMSSPYVHDVYADGNLVYLSEVFDGVHVIADSTDPDNLQILSSVQTPHDFTHNSWANDAQTVVVTTDEVPGGTLGIYDITDKTEPALLAEYDSGTGAYIHNAMFDDDNERVAISHYTLGVKYVDLHVPDIPLLLASFDTYPNDDNADFDGNWGVYTHDPRGYIYASDRATGLYVLEYVPTGGVLSGVVTDAASGSPLAGAELLILPAESVELSRPDGGFATYVDEGEIVVRVSLHGYKTLLLTADMPLGGVVDLDIELQPLPKVPLAGTVRRADTLEGIAGASVSVVGESLAATTVADGSFQFLQVPIGQRTVTAEALGFSSQEARVVLSANGPGSVELLLEPGMFADDIENDTDWSAGLFDIGVLSGSWERVDPNGTGGGAVQPEDDHTPAPGVTAFITGQSPPGAGINDNDVEGGTTTLLSPRMDATTLDAPRLRYHSWLSNNAGVVTAGQLRVEASPDDGSSWFPLELQTVNANSWVRREFDLDSFLPALTEVIRIRFRAEPGSFSSNLQVLECGVDDVDLVSGCVARFSPELDDGDGDGVVDSCDDCPLNVANDADSDGFCGNEDNTPFIPSPNQDDADGDQVGDAGDNCLLDANTDQRDLDADGLGDACDPDVDGDGLANAMDPDDDGDGIPDASNVCATVADPLQNDQDDDGEGDACDPDDGEVQGDLFGADGLITWEPETDTDSYNLYRGALGAEGLLPFAACRMNGIRTPYFVDLDLPIPDSGLFYLVSRVAGGLEGSLGFKSDGSERQVNGACP